MVKNSLNKLLLVFLVLLFWVRPVRADENYSALFVKITDASTAVKEKDQPTARALLEEVKAEFTSKLHHDSAAGKKVSQALDISGEVTQEKLTKISAALLDFEKEQDPVDLEAEKNKLMNRLNPQFETLKEAILTKDLNQTKNAYKKLNSTWTLNEGVVRDHSTVYYGKIETALSFLRTSIETEPTDFTVIQASFEDLKTGVDDFIKGKKVKDNPSDLTLQDGIELLKKSLRQFQSGDSVKATATMKEFITIWPTIEGAVSTSKPSLYTRVESESPVIMAKGKEKHYQDQLQELITELSAIDTAASYTVFDAMLILLREGVEALLIVMALVTTLKASQLQKGLKWVYAGALAGVLCSALIALVLQLLFPAVTSASNREIIEGAVGIFAVVMMILIGIWLHRKSSIRQWKNFMKKQMQTVTATGSFLSMFVLSFLAVFREGAETILFYVGIIPRITTVDFLLGIALALFILAVIALFMTKASQFFEPHRIFFILTWLIYVLAFKMLGVSIHALQLTNILPTHLISRIPTIDWAGIYPSWEGMTAQLLFVLVVAFVTVYHHEKG